MQMFVSCVSAGQYVIVKICTEVKVGCFELVQSLGFDIWYYKMVRQYHVSVIYSKEIKIKLSPCFNVQVILHSALRILKRPTGR